MELIKTVFESQPVVETLDHEKIVVAQSNGMITVIYIQSNKILSIQLNGEAVQILIHKTSIYVSTKPFLIGVANNSEESEEVLTNNLLAGKKTGSTLWKIDIREDTLLIDSRFDHVGGFAIQEDKVYACNIVSYGFYRLTLDLIEIEKISVHLEPSTRKPWHSNITIVDRILFLIQEEERIRWFKLGSRIEEMGIVEPEFIHRTSFVSVNSAPKKILKIGSHILGILASGEPYVISFVEGKPSVAVDPKTVFNLKYKDELNVLNSVQAASDFCVLAMDRYRVIVTDQEMNAVLHSFCFDEVDESLNLTRIAVFGKYAICFAWTYSKKYPVIIIDLNDPQTPVILKVVDCGTKSGKIQISEDE